MSSLAKKRAPNDRSSNQIRPLTLETGWNRYAEGSVLVKAGHTHVLCTASIEESIPNWLKGKQQGWITAEYSMLPRATHTRGKRDREKVSGRTQEIQRLIGRALRMMVNLEKLGERSILIDCDVLQADGGTRTASITGGCVALTLALQSLIKKGDIPADTITTSVSAISLGVFNGNILVDLDYEEDVSCDADVNFVVTGQGNLVEIQGTAEKQTFSPELLSKLTGLALEATAEIKKIQDHALSQS